MKAQRLMVMAVIALVGTISAEAHEVDPGGKIKVICRNDTARMGEVARAVKNSDLHASQAARIQMLSLARQACEHRAKVVTFVPSDDQR